MKKLLLVAMVFAVTLLVAGCGGGTTTYSDPGQKISVSANQEFVIALDSNPTTGYSWQESHDAAALTMVEKKYEAGKTAQGVVGAGGTEFFRFKALKAGETTITMSYQRPWEKEAIKKQVFTVNIK